MNLMHGVDNFKIVLVQKTKRVNNYRNTKLKLFKVNATIWFHKQSLIYHVTPKHTQIH
jgi:hypothetical protein